MSTVRIPVVMRQHTGGVKQVSVDGSTVQEVLLTLATHYPALQGQLFENGELRRFVNVYLNDQDIQYLDKLATPVGPSDTVIILPAMAGG
jgi:molybdopterin converting factor small subunit